MEYEDGTAYKMTNEDASKAGIIASGRGSQVINSISPNDLNPPLYIVDGVIRDRKFLDALNSEDIKSVNVNILKGVEALKKYGDKGKNGVIEVEIKKKNENITVTANEITLSTDKTKMQNDKTDLTLVGNVNINGSLGDTPIYVDGKQVTEKEFRAIEPSKIDVVNIEGGKEANKKIIYVSLKKSAEPKIYIGRNCSWT